MDYQSILKKQRTSFLEMSKKFIKDDFKYLTNKSSFNQKRIGVFTRAYYKRKKLVQLGVLTYGLVVRIRDEHNPSNPSSTWVLFSPSLEFEKNPANYEKILQNLDEIVNSDDMNKKYKRLKIMLKERYSEPSYFPIPPELCDNKIVYLSHVYYWKDKNPNFKLGIKPIFVGQNITKEILYLPEKYWIKEFKKLF